MISFKTLYYLPFFAVPWHFICFYLLTIFLQETIASASGTLSEKSGPSRLTTQSAADDQWCEKHSLPGVSRLIVAHERSGPIVSRNVYGCEMCKASFQRIWDLEFHNWTIVNRLSSEIWRIIVDCHFIRTKLLCGKGNLLLDCLSGLTPNSL